MDRKPTKKQLSLIEGIEKELKIDFDGETFEDAKTWISEYYEEFMHSKNDLKEEYAYWKDDS